MDNLIKNIADLIPITCDNDGKVTGNQFFDGIKSIFKDNIYVRNTPEMWVGKLYSYLREEEFWRIVKEIGWPNKTPDLTPHNIKFVEVVLIMNPQELKCSQCENPTFKDKNIVDKSLTKTQIVCTNCGTVHIYQKLQLNFKINLT